MSAIDFLQELKKTQTGKYAQEWLNEAIQALKQMDALDKIRAEIEELDKYYDNDYFSTNNCPMYKCNEVLQIIDKYKAESEESKDANSH